MQLLVHLLAPCFWVVIIIRTHLDLLHPDIGSRVQAKQLDQKTAVDTHRRMHHFAVGQGVMTRDFYNGGRWVPGTVIDQSRPVSYRIRVQGGGYGVGI